MPLCHLEDCTVIPLGYLFHTTVFVVTMADGSLWSADSVVGEKPMTPNDWFTVKAYQASHLMKVPAGIALQDGGWGWGGEGITFGPAVLKEVVLHACRYEGMEPSTVETLDEYMHRTRTGS